MTGLRSRLAITRRVHGAPGQHRGRRVQSLALFAALIVVLTLPATALAAKPVEQFHDNFTDRFLDNVCGIDVETAVVGVDNFTLYDDDSFLDRGSALYTHTNLTNGKAVKISVAGLIRGTAVVDEEAGTVTFINSFKGLPEKIQTKHGSVLLRDAGFVTISDTFDLETGDFLGREFTIAGGPHPDLESDFALFCEVIVPALT